MSTKNIITATITFSFKGQTFTPTSTIDLDTHMRVTGHVPDLHMLIARDNEIGLYSYEYEMLQAETIRIKEAQGMVTKYVSNGVLDIEAFEPAWQEQQIQIKISQLLEQHKLDSLVQQHPELKKLLLAVYQAGKQDNTSELDG